MAIIILLAGIAGAVWLVLTEPKAAGGTMEVVLDLPPPPAAPAAEPPAVAEAASEPVAQTPAVDATAVQEQAAIAATSPPAEQELPAWRRFARSFPANDVRPRIAIVVNALGQKEDLTRAAIEQLPPEVTLSFSPYAGCALKADGDLTCTERLEQLMKAAREAGHEVLLDLPMEPRTYPSDDPGPRALLTSLDHSENAERLNWVLGRGEGYIGIATYMGSRFTASPDHLRPVLEELGQRGLLFFDSSYGAGSAGPELAAKLGVPRAVNGRFLDSEPSRAAIDARLAQLERQARAQGAAVAMALPYPVTVERISGWAKTLAAKGLALAPVSALADTRRQE